MGVKDTVTKDYMCTQGQTPEPENKKAKKQMKAS